MGLACIHIFYIFKEFLDHIKSRITAISFCGEVVKLSTCMSGVLCSSLGFSSLLNATLNLGLGF